MVAGRFAGKEHLIPPLFLGTRLSGLIPQIKEDVANQIGTRRLMVMQICRAVALSMLVVSLFWVAPVDASGSAGGYIYDLLDRGSNLSIVINGAGNWAGIQNRRGADPAADPGEFSGPIGDCSDVTFLCIDGPLLIRVPRDPGLTGWRYHGVSCLARPLVAGVLRYNCHTTIYGRRVDTAYDYSLSRGVIAFQRMPLFDRGRFRLRGQRGIFSDGPLAER